MTTTKRDPAQLVIVGNTYVGNKQPDKVRAWVTEHDPAIGLLCEVNAAVRHALWDAGHELALTDPNHEGQRECAVVLPKGTKAKHSSVPLTPFVSRPFAPDRAVALAQRPGHAAIAMHANAVIQTAGGTWKANKGAEVWRDQGLPRLGQLLDHLQETGHGVVIGGDWNAATGKKSDDVDPVAFLRKHGLKAEALGYMVLGYTPDTYAVEKRVDLPTVPGADAHKALAVWLRGA